MGKIVHVSRAGAMKASMFQHYMDYIDVAKQIDKIQVRVRQPKNKQHRYISM